VAPCTGRLILRKELQGPECMTHWFSSWRVFVVAGLILEIVSEAALQSYERTVEKLFRMWSAAWYLIVVADDKCRAEHMERIQRRTACTVSAGHPRPTDGMRSVHGQLSSAWPLRTPRSGTSKFDSRSQQGCRWAAGDTGPHRRRTQLASGYLVDWEPWSRRSRPHDSDHVIISKKVKISRRGGRDRRRHPRHVMRQQLERRPPEGSQERRQGQGQFASADPRARVPAASCRPARCARSAARTSARWAVGRAQAWCMPFGVGLGTRPQPPLGWRAHTWRTGRRPHRRGPRSTRTLRGKRRWC
jgi:hypothetical protein